MSVSSTRRVGALCLCTALAGLAVAATPARDGVPTAGADWLHATGDAGNTHHSSLRAIDRRNVARLGAAWTTGPFDDGATSRATPVVQDGIVYFTAGAKVYAIDGRDGHCLWTYETNGTPLAVSGMMGGSSAPQGRGTPNRQGPALGDGRLYVGLSDGHLIALDQHTGNLLWDRELDPEARTHRGGVSASPVYSRGIVYTSLTFDEARYVGRAVALDAKTGAQLWRWDSIPAPGQPQHESWGASQELVDGIAWKMGGASVWLPPIVDEALGLAIFVTGNPSPNRAGGLRPGDNLYSSSVVALDTKSGTLRWHFQATHHDLWEMDLPVPPVSYETVIDGKARHGLAAMRPDGTVFLLDRATGEPLYPVEERAVPQNPVHATSPTQPFPRGKGSVIERGCDAWKTLPPGMELVCDAFLPPAEDRYALMFAPSSRPSQMAFSPESGLLYVNGNDRLQFQWASDRPFNWEFLDPFLAGRTPKLVDSDARMVFVAVDPRSYAIVWRKEFPVAAVYGVGGFLTTGGGLAFHRLGDGRIVAYDAKDGTELWSWQTGITPTGPAYPFSYLAGGQQYVAVMQERELIAFRLGGTVPPRAAPSLPASGGFFDSPVEDTRLIRAQVPNDYGYRFAIGPQRARVRVGETINFVNNGAEIRDFTAVDGSWTTGAMLPRQVKALVFDKPGRYLYQSKRQPWSFAELIVVPAEAAVGAASGGGANGSGAAASGGGFAAQAELGKRRYQESCASCHGDELRGRDAIPTLVGAPFLAKYPTAKSLYDRTRTTMPQGAPATLSPGDYLAITAYTLGVNEHRPADGAALTVDNAASLAVGATR